MKKSLISRKFEKRKRRSSIHTLVQWGILILSILTFMAAENWMFHARPLFSDMDATVIAASLAASKSAIQETYDNGDINNAFASPKTHAVNYTEIATHLKAARVRQSGAEVVRQYIGVDKEPLRHLRFSDLDLPPIDIKDPVMNTAFQESTVISQAPWFPQRRFCEETCCAEAVAISLDQDDTRIINAVDGPDLADLLLYGHTPPSFHQFAARELTHEVIPCLRPGVVIHADSYRGPITRFFEEYRPNMTVPYVFITSKTDGATPITFFKDRLDTDPLLTAWYGINPTYDTGANHSKYRAMALGLTGNKFRQQPDLNLLMKARNYANPFGGDKSRWTNETLWKTATDTTPLLFVKFGLHINALHREIPFNMACQNRTMKPLDDISCTIDTGANPRQTYTAAAKYLFGLSPRGNGKDCFRTYELLLNGVIPIVNAQPEYDELFKDLPILQLDHWNYNQTDLLKLMHDYVTSPEFLDNTFDAGWERLFLRYWRRKVLEDAGRLNEIVTDDQGREYYTGWVYSLHKKPHIQHATKEYLEKKKKEEEEMKEKKKEAENTKLEEKKKA